MRHAEALSNGDRTNDKAVKDRAGCLRSVAGIRKNEISTVDGDRRESVDGVNRLGFAG